MAFIDIGDQFINLSEGRTRGPDKERHFGLVVDDKEKVRRRLKQAGVETLPGRGVEFRDPWGNRVQIVISDALGQTEGSGERQFAAELHRIAGMVLLTQGKLVEAESSFRRAIEIARAQSAKMWELRASRSLAGLLARQGKREEARTTLADVYGWFTEGFDTADLNEAKTLLDELSA
jgi:hypothetical protein